MPASGSVVAEVRSFTEMKLGVFGGFNRKTMARSWPPVREAKWWTRSSVVGRLESSIQEGARRSTRSWRDDSMLPELGLMQPVSGIATS